ncbi:MAG: hypothetical protein FJ263_07780 [Planctomycetes bacterium]|nr:hypothetical protein [Planctomycetota bacterium]
METIGRFESKEVFHEKDAMRYAVSGMGAFFSLFTYAGEITIGTRTAYWPWPLNTDYHDARSQTIYLASGIGGAKTFDSFSLNVVGKPGQTMNNFTIRLKHTDLSSYGNKPVWESSGWTTVYQANKMVSTTGWVAFVFTTPFVYNGTQNLMVDISFNNSSYTTCGLCYCTSSSVNPSIHYETNSSYGDPLSWSSRTPVPYRATYFTDIKLGFGNLNVLFRPDGGIYNTEQNVVITCTTPGATIRYTLDGSDPNEGIVYEPNSIILVDHTLTLKAKAWKGDMPPSSVASAIYNLDVSTPTFSVDGGTYNNEFNVVISCATPGATIHYTTNGLNPTESDPVIASGSSVLVNQSTTLKARAWKGSMTPSNVKSATYQLVVATPAFSVSGGTYNTEKYVTITCATPGATIHYTINGVDPTENDPVIASGGSIYVDRSMTLKAKAWKGNMTSSSIKSATYSLVVSKPTFSVTGGTYSTEKYVIITCATPGATIRYTTDGSDPNTGAIYDPNIPVVIDHSLTLKAKAWKGNMTPSSIQSATYQLFVATPVFTPDGGGYEMDQTVVITCATPGTTIRYTTDGSNPNNGMVIENGGSVIVSSDPPTTLKAKAFKTGWPDSAIKSSIYYAARIIYVNHTATGDADGTSWQNAYPDLPLALADAVNGDEIWVAMGTYYSPANTFQLKNNMALYGGFAGFETLRTQRDWKTNKTILSGNNIRRVFYHPASLQLNISAILDGFTIADGNVYVEWQAWAWPWPDRKEAAGGGILNENCSPTIRNCIFLNNTAYGYVYDTGGISPIQDAAMDMYILHCLGYGGGIYNLNSNPVIENCMFIGNSAIVGGAGIENVSSSPTITNCVFYGNTAQEYFYSRIDYDDYLDCSIACGIGNNTNSFPVITNCTIANNINEISVTNVSGSHPIIVNSILWDRGWSINNMENASCTVSYSNMRGGSNPTGTGNINLDPKFHHVPSSDPMNTPDWDALSLQASSPCIDAGNNAAVPAAITTDITGDPRFFDAPNTLDTGVGTPPIVDMGAYEYSPPVKLSVFNLLSQYWLMTGCTTGQPCAAADWYVDGTIDILDLDVLAEFWLAGAIQKQYPPEPKVLTAHWPMDESAGSSTVSDTAGGHTGQLVNMDPNTCWTTGYYNNALQLDGINDYVRITGYKGIGGSHARTCTAWIKAVGSGQHQIAIGWGSTDPAQTFYIGGIYTAAGNITEFAVGIGYNSYIKSYARPFDNQWHHLAVVVPDDGTPTTNEIKLYLDGQRRTDTYVYNSLAINTSGTSDVLLGAYSGHTPPDLFFKGLLDDVRIYNYALSDAEITALAQ